MSGDPDRAPKGAEGAGVDRLLQESEGGGSSSLDPGRSGRTRSDRTEVSMMGPRDQFSAMVPIARLIVSSAVEALTAQVNTRSRENARTASAALREGAGPYV